MRIKASLMAFAIGGAIALGGCGDSNEDKVKEITRNAQQQGQELQEKARRLQQQVADGKITAEEAAREIAKDARDITNENLDRVKELDLPDDAKDQIDQAQDQLDDIDRQIEEATR